MGFLSNSSDSFVLDNIREGEDVFPDITITCPENIRIPNDPGTEYAMITWNEPTILGYEGEPFYVIESTHFPGTRFHLGTTQVTYKVWTATQYTLLAECQFDVNIIGKN